MKQRDSILSGLQSLILIVAAVSGGLPLVSYCKDARPGQVTLFIQQTPAQGGTITPSAGFHHFAPNSQVTLTAVPRSGYQFTYWLGDVGDPTASSTSIFLNRPKVVVAVFEPLEQDYCAQGPSIRASGAGGGAFASEGDYAWDGSMWLGSGTVAPEGQTSSWPTFPAAAIPEPATLLLLGLGAVALRKSRRRCCR